MKSNPKTLAGVILLVILAIGLGFLLSRIIPTIGEVQREMSLTPTPLPEVPDNVMAVTRDPSAPTPEPVLRTGSRGEEVKTLQMRLRDLGYYSDDWSAPKQRRCCIPRRQNRRQASNGIKRTGSKRCRFSYAVPDC